MVEETSVNVYREIIDEGLVVSAQQRVLDTLKKYGASTDSEIASFLGYGDPNKVRPRRKELVDEGLVVRVGTSKCEVSGRVVYVWDLASGVSKVSDKPVCLSDVQFRGVIKKLGLANGFQKRKVRDWLDSQLEEGL
jgi:hypothetical protein